MAPFFQMLLVCAKLTKLASTVSLEVVLTEAKSVASEIQALPTSPLKNTGPDCLGCQQENLGPQNPCLLGLKRSWRISSLQPLMGHWGRGSGWNPLLLSAVVLSLGQWFCSEETKIGRERERERRGKGGRESFKITGNAVLSFNR